MLRVVSWRIVRRSSIFRVLEGSDNPANEGNRARCNMSFYTGRVRHIGGALVADMHPGAILCHFDAAPHCRY